MAETLEEIRARGEEWMRTKQDELPLATADELQAILNDIQAGRPGPPDEPRRLAGPRERMAQQVADIASLGATVDFPSDLPEL